jgi:hypothetical protein
MTFAIVRVVAVCSRAEDSKRRETIGRRIVQIHGANRRLKGWKGAVTDAASDQHIAVEQWRQRQSTGG